MKIGLWNIDHPETATGSARKQRRFDAVADYLSHAECDAYIITEANAAMCPKGFFRAVSAESPFKSAGRSYGSPNIYHQVAIYTREPAVRTEVAEPVNGLRVTVEIGGHSLVLYGNVVTIKDQWSKDSNLTYSDRLDQQIDAIRNLPRRRALAAGDFNLRLGWPQKKSAHKRVKDRLAVDGWDWPTESREDTVQHVLHTPDLQVDVRADFSVKYGKNRSAGLSDHPFIGISISFGKLPLESLSGT